MNPARGRAAALVTPRLRLLLVRCGDVPRLLPLYSDPDIVRHAYDGEPPSRSAVLDEVRRASRLWKDRGYGTWVIEDRATASIAGQIGFLAQSGWSWLFLAWMIGPEFRGRGYATEAGSAVLDLAFRELDPPLLVSMIRPANAASIRVAQKLGGRHYTTVRSGNDTRLIFQYSPA
jgi:[ribosomal protein S5]-alanine N-acetyltransferase